MMAPSTKMAPTAAENVATACEHCGTVPESVFSTGRFCRLGCRNGFSVKEGQRKKAAAAAAAAVAAAAAAAAAKAMAERSAKVRRITDGKVLGGWTCRIQSCQGLHEEFYYMDVMCIHCGAHRVCRCAASGVQMCRCAGVQMSHVPLIAGSPPHGPPPVGPGVAAAGAAAAAGGGARAAAGAALHQQGAITGTCNICHEDDMQLVKTWNCGEFIHNVIQSSRTVGAVIDFRVARRLHEANHLQRMWRHMAGPKGAKTRRLPGAASTRAIFPAALWTCSQPVQTPVLLQVCKVSDPLRKRQPDWRKRQRVAAQPWPVETAVEVKKTQPAVVRQFCSLISLTAD